MNFLFVLFISGLQLWAKNLPEMKGIDLINNQKVEFSWNGSNLGTVVVFLSTNCPCSNNHISYLNNLKKNWPKFTFVGIHSNLDENLDESINYFKKSGLNFPILQDEKTHLADLFGAHRTPHSFIVSPKGEILYQGGVTSSSDPKKADIFYLNNALDEISKNRPILVDRSRVLGCEIERE